MTVDEVSRPVGRGQLTGCEDGLLERLQQPSYTGEFERGLAEVEAGAIAGRVKEAARNSINEFPFSDL